MRWLWTNVLRPALKTSLSFLWHVFRWAWHNPVTAVFVGGAVVLTARILLQDTPERRWLVSLGLGIIATGIGGYLFDQMFGWAGAAVRAVRREVERSIWTTIIGTGPLLMW